MPRISWDELPAGARAAVAERVGQVRSAANAVSGLNSGIAARLDTKMGEVFVKGMPANHPQVSTQQREAAINSYLPPGCPRLLWRIETAGWDLLGFEFLAGDTADFAPGSHDVPKLVEALDVLAGTPCPGPAVPLKRADERWGAYLDPAALALLDGDHLLHTDIAPHNVLICADGAHLIDWAWPTRGPAWIDPAVWIIRLIDAGHSPAQAEEWAAQLPAWHAAPATALTAFANANAALWRQVAAQERLSAWKQRMCP